MQPMFASFNTSGKEVTATFGFYGAAELVGMFNWFNNFMEKPENTELSRILTRVRNCKGKKLVVEKWPKTVYRYLHVCIRAGV